jgi:integrase
VTFAAWNDIDFTKSECNVRRKEDVGFAPKSHESRAIPLPASLVALLKSRRKNHPRWVFLNKDGKPDNHFMRKLNAGYIRRRRFTGSAFFFYSRILRVPIE